MEPHALKAPVALVGEDGNAFAILGRVKQAMQRDGWSPEEIKEYTDRATSGDYDELLATTLEYADDE